MNWTLFFCVCLLSESSTPRVQHTQKNWWQDFFYFSFFSFWKEKKKSDRLQEEDLLCCVGIYMDVPPFSLCLLFARFLVLRGFAASLVIIPSPKALDWTFNPPTPLLLLLVSNIWTRGIQTRRFYIPEKRNKNRQWSRAHFAIPSSSCNKFFSSSNSI